MILPTIHTGCSKETTKQAFLVKIMYCQVKVHVNNAINKTYMYIPIQLALKGNYTFACLKAGESYESLCCGFKEVLADEAFTLEFFLGG